MAAALDILAGGGVSPSISPLNAANPIAKMPVTANAIDNLRSDVAIQNPEDAFNTYLMSMIPSAAQMAQSKAAVMQQQQAQQEARAQQMQYLQAQYSPEREAALNWQTIGNAGAAALANPNNPWGASASTQMQGITNNRASLEDAQARYEAAKIGNADAAAAAAQAQYKMEVEQQKEGIKGIIDYRKELSKNKGTGIVTVTDTTGRVFAYDKNSGAKTLVLDSNGLTPQNMSNLGDLQNKLVEQYGSDSNGMAIVTKIVNQKRDELIAFNRQNVGQIGAIEQAPQAPGLRNDIALPYNIEESPLGAPFTDAERTAMVEDFKKSRPNGEATFDLFEPEELKGVQLQPPIGADKLTQDNWADIQKKASTEAFKDEEAARANLAQATAMYESSKAALALGAKTSALQPFVNNFASVLGALGVKDRLTDEAVRGKTFEAIKNQAVQVLQNAAKGPQTEGDANRFKESLVQVKNAAEANKLIAKFMEAQVWKARAEVDFRGKYTNIPNQAPTGASAKWQDWSTSVPTILRIKDRPVFVQDFVNHMVQDNPDIVKQFGETYVRREAIKEWRKLQN